MKNLICVVLIICLMLLSGCFLKEKSDGGMITEIMDQNSVVAYDEQQLKDMADYKLGNEKDMMKGLILGSGLLKPVSVLYKAPDQEYFAVSLKSVFVDQDTDIYFLSNRDGSTRPKTQILTSFDVRVR